MTATIQSKPETHGIIASLGRFELPLELDRIHLFGRGNKEQLCFRFAFREVPFSCTAKREDGGPTLALTGDFGSLPYTAEGSERRRTVQTVIAVAQRRSGLRWTVTPQQQIEVSGDIALDLPLTPTALVAGTVALLLRVRPYLDLLLEALTAPAQREGSVTT